VLRLFNLIRRSSFCESQLTADTRLESEVTERFFLAQKNETIPFQVARKTKSRNIERKRDYSLKFEIFQLKCNTASSGRGKIVVLKIAVVIKEATQAVSQS